jgi:hypothetical protein
VAKPRARHGEDLTVYVFVPGLADAFSGQVLVFREVGDSPCGLHVRMVSWLPPGGKVLFDRGERSAIAHLQYWTNVV